jgi:hypothetical protein
VAEDRHQGIAHRAQAHAGEVRRHELPAVGQLERDHLAAGHAAAGEHARRGCRALGELAVGEACRGLRFLAPGDERAGLGLLGEPAVEVVGDDAVGPQAAPLLLLEPLLRQ